MTEQPFSKTAIDQGPASVVYLVIGIPGSGKSTVSAALARQLERAAHIEADDLQALIVSSGHLPSPRHDPEADRQLLLRARHASLLARSFHAAGMVPVIDDVVVRKNHLDFYLEQTKRSATTAHCARSVRGNRPSSRRTAR